jgi:hypothetical protein
MMPEARRGREIIGEIEAHSSHLPDCTLGQQLPNLLVAAVVALVVAGHQLHSIGPTSVNHLLGLLRVERQGFFAQDMPA